MQLAFDVSERRAGPGEVAIFPLTLHNDSDQSVNCSYDVTADEDEFDTDWCRLSAPVSLGPGARKSAELTVQLPKSVGPRTYHVQVLVRTDQANGDARDVCVLVVPAVRCARVRARPVLTLNPDGTVTAAIGILNCGNLDLNCNVDLRHRDGWLFQAEDGQLTLNVDIGTVEIDVTYRPPPGDHPSVGDELRIEVRVEGVVLVETAAKLQSPPHGGPSPKWTVLIALPIVLLLVLLIVLGLRALATARDDDEKTIPSTTTGTSGTTKTTLATTSSSSSSSTTPTTVVPARFSVAPNSVDSSFPATISLRNAGPGTIIVRAPQLSGVDAASYRISASTCASATLEPGESCSVTVELRPVGEGTHLATLLIPVDGAAQPGRASLRATVVN